MDKCNIQNPNLDSVKKNSKSIPKKSNYASLKNLRSKLRQDYRTTLPMNPSLCTLTKRLEQEDAVNN